jgi:hypothetical protein
MQRSAADAISLVNVLYDLQAWWLSEMRSPAHSCDVLFSVGMCSRNCGTRQVADPKKQGLLSTVAFNVLMWMKSMRSIVEPGEPVGVLAAQSVGEPSTQVRTSGHWSPAICVLPHPLALVKVLIRPHSGAPLVPLHLVDAR